MVTAFAGTTSWIPEVKTITTLTLMFPRISC
jgi:hypothetical protein